MRYEDFKGIIVGIALIVINVKFEMEYLNYVGIFLIVISIFQSVYPYINKRLKFRNAELLSIDQMSGTEFEEYTAFLLEQNGFSKVKVTKQYGDQGIDVIAQKDNIKYGIQCKRWKKNVGNKAVQEVYAGIGYYKLDRAIVFTNSQFTKSAQELAKQLDVELWNRTQLSGMIETYRLNNKQTN